MFALKFLKKMGVWVINFQRIKDKQVFLLYFLKKKDGGKAGVHCARLGASRLQEARPRCAGGLSARV